MSTTFKAIKTQNKDTEAEYIAEPILASFPNNIPPAEVLQNMKFSISEQENQTTNAKLKKRVIKAETKGIRYHAKNFDGQSNKKDQASDYFVGVFDQNQNKVYMIPVNHTYQFTQEIEGFKEAYGHNEDLDNNMSYMDQKLRLVNAFGTRKAIKKVTSQVNNMVDETGVTNKNNKGVRDERLKERANELDGDMKTLKKEILNAVGRRNQLYTIENLLPEPVLKDIPYKNTLTSLNLEKYDDIKTNYVFTYFVQNMLYDQQKIIVNVKDEKEQHNIIRSFLYLDRLIMFYRMPQQIFQSPEQLSKTLDIPVAQIEHILNEFSDISLMNQSRIGQSENKDHEYKYIKSKENIKKLSCHIIAIILHLNKGSSMKASEISKLLKKEISELKSYFQEVGFHYTIVEETGEMLIDLMPDEEEKEAMKKAKKELRAKQSAANAVAKQANKVPKAPKKPKAK